MHLKPIIRMLCAALLLTSAVSAQNPDAAKGGPKIAIAETTHNFGELKKGVEAKHSFVFKNEGAVELEIKNVAPS